MHISPHSIACELGWLPSPGLHCAFIVNEQNFDLCNAQLFINSSYIANTFRNRDI